jgi:parallel beta-helix repeat protein
MKKIYSILTVSALLTAGNAMAIETYETTGDGATYTFASLSQIEGSGVTVDADGVYTAVKNITMGVNDTLRIENNSIIKLGDGVLVKLSGHGDFAPADTAVVTIAAEGATPKGFQFYADNSSAVIKNITFEVAAVKYGGATPLTVNNCTFLNTNMKLASAGAISFAGASVGNVVTNCRFLHTVTSAIGGGANVATGLLFENNYLEDCVTYNGNRPFINLTVGGNADVIVRGNTVRGNKLKRPGGITIANTLGISGTNNVLIENNYIDNTRYGINAQGRMKVTIKNNTLINNHWEDNPNNGGSGISIYAVKDTAYIEGNTITGSLWGVTLIGSAPTNLGKTADPAAADYNPGNNVFSQNGNNGAVTDATDEQSAWDPSNPYDLYNNTALTIYAQGNTWGVDEQTAEKIETVIYHKYDNDSLGEVIYMPSESGVSDVLAADSDVVVAVSGKTIRIEGAEGSRVEVYNAAGQLQYSGLSREVSLKAAGVYVVNVAGKVFKVAL